MAQVYAGAQCNASTVVGFKWEIPLNRLSEEGTPKGQRQVFVLVMGHGPGTATSLAGHPENWKRPRMSKAVTWKGQFTQSKANLSLAGGKCGGQGCFSTM